MPKSLSTVRTPEEEELEQKQDELRAKEAQLVEKELELSTIQAELLQFNGRYVLVVGWLLVELDQLRADRARRAAKADPEDVEAERRAQEAERRARKSRSEFENAQAETAPYVHRPEPTAELKATYRRLAKTYHPDFADDEEEIVRRNKLMARINAAYGAGDLDTLRQIELDAEQAPEAVRGHDLAAQMLRIIRTIHQVDRRLEEINEQIRKVKLGDDWRLCVEWKQAKEQGVDILERLAKDLRTKIQAERARQVTRARRAAKKGRPSVLKQVAEGLRAKIAPGRAARARRKRRATSRSRPARGRK